MNSPSPVDAERAYAAMAQRIGQWTAFRATAAPGAVLFVPDPVDAATFLKDRKDPPVAVKWQPAQSYLSCDRRTGANLGPWQRPTSVRYFATVWSRSGGTWRWDLDFGDALDAAMAPAPATSRRAALRAEPPGRRCSQSSNRSPRLARKAIAAPPLETSWS